MSDPVPAQERRAQLDGLIDSLSRLVAILRCDSQCQWTAHFEQMLHDGQRIATSSQLIDLSAYSSAVMHVFGGAGSFNDYFPGRYDSLTGRIVPIPGTEDYERTARQVAEQASELRVVGRR